MDGKEFFKGVYNNALDKINNNKLHEGLLELEKLYMYNSDDADIINLLFLCNLKYCNFTKCKSYITKSIKICTNTKTLEYYNFLKDIYSSKLPLRYYSIIRGIKNGDEASQISKLEEIKNEYPYLIEPYLLLSYLYYKHKRYILARKYISLAHKLDSSNYHINNLYLKLKL